MGLTFLTMELANPANPTVTETVKFLIDSGAHYSLVPRPVLERLGIRPMRMETFHLANGQTMDGWMDDVDGGGKRGHFGGRNGASCVVTQ
jgi:hypothetical protein